MTKLGDLKHAANVIAESHDELTAEVARLRAQLAASESSRAALYTQIKENWEPALQAADRRINEEFARANVAEAEVERLKRLLEVAVSQAILGGQERDRLVEALTPSAYTKADYIGEFKTRTRDGDNITVSWTATKEIMGKILARAALQPPAQEGVRMVRTAPTDLCEDCPPIGYPTDKTRCLPCPRRRVPMSDGESSLPPTHQEET